MTISTAFPIFSVQAVFRLCLKSAYMGTENYPYLFNTGEPTTAASRPIVADFLQTESGRAIIRDVFQDTLAVGTSTATSAAAPPPSQKPAQATDASATPSTKSTLQYMSRLRKRKNSKSPAPPSKTMTPLALKTIKMPDDGNDEESDDDVASADNSDSELEHA